MTEITDLQEYVDRLFRHQQATPQIIDLKEEIVSNMIAKRDDLIAQGWDAKSATEKAKESLSAVDFLIEGNQLTDVDKYHQECMQATLLHSVIFWILSLPLLFTGYSLVCYMGLALVIASGYSYISKKKESENAVAFLSVTASKRRRKIVWIIWGLFFLVATGTMAAVTFGSNLWFGRPLHITGPYEMANIAVRFYVPLLTILIPITFHSFTNILLKNRKEQEDASEK
jgi:hypothetical protein